MKPPIIQNNNELQGKKSSEIKKYVLKKASYKAEFKIDYQNELNKSQFEAVSSVEGPLLIIAGAGSGKTRTLVYRTAYLVESGIKPENILLLTFTRKAANEMLKRASTILDSRCEKISGGTFHSFANIILRKYSNALGLKNSFTILDRSDSEDAVNLFRNKFIENKKIRFPRKSTICDIYSKAINKNSSINDIIEREFPHFDYCIEQITEICSLYNAYKRENSLLDYDDLLIYLLTLLKSEEAVKRSLSDTHKYIMVDEYQDTNQIQADIIRELAFTHNNVAVVGDDSQSIYSFRGANFKNIMDFPKTFQNTKIITLEENFRSTKEILNLTNEIIAQAKEKYPKKLFSRDKTGDIPALVCAKDMQTESEFVSQRICELIEEGISLKDIAVLSRSSSTTYNLELELNKRKIPFKKFGGYKFSETAHIKDVIAHLRVILNPDDKISLNRILLLIKGIGSSTSSKLMPLFSEKNPANNLMITAGNKFKNEISKLQELIIRSKNPDLSLLEIVSAVIEYYLPYFKEKYDDFNKREKDLGHFLDLAKNYKSLERFLSDMAVEPPNSSVLDIEEGSVKDEYLTLSTIHSAKGLEWDTVFVIGAVEGKFPSIYAFNNLEDLEEERRLFYVACTRAKNNLYITYPIDMFDHAMNITLSMPSRFVENIEDSLLEKWLAAAED